MINIMQNENLKTVAIIGRPNVGKSTLFNRLIGRREAIESEVPGTTRDRLYGEVFWQGRKFILIDVAGVENGSHDEITENTQEGIKLAIESADLLLFIVDWSEKENEVDKSIARTLRRLGKKVILAVNKCDNLERINSISEFKRFGNFEVVPVSAISGKSSGDLLDIIIENLPTDDTNIHNEKNKSETINLTIIGRPNVGKSTLLNSIIGQKRAVVAEEPGTTRDTIAVKFNHKGQKFNLIDTAGIRRRGKIIKDTIESFSLLRTEKALRESDIAVVLIDAKEGLVAKDANLLGQAKEKGKGIILAVNKIDLWDDTAKKEEMAKILYKLQTELNFIPWLPVVFISAKENENVKPLLNQAVKVWENCHKIIEQKDLDTILDDAKNSNNQLVKITSLIQKRSNPPMFELRFKGEEPHYTQIRYLENKIRDSFPLEGTPIFIDLVRKMNRRKR